MITYKLKNKNNKMSVITGLSFEEMEEMFEENSSLRGYFQGYRAEFEFRKQLKALPEVTSVIKIPDQDPEKGDFRVIYKNVPITIEVKSILTNSVKEDVLNNTWQGTVSMKNTDKREIEVEGIGTISSSCLERGQFDILAISCYAVSGKWDVVFMENEYLPSKGMTPTLIKTSMVVNPETTPCLVVDLSSVLESVYHKKTDVKIEHD